jgi:hypothetical protein
MLPRSENTPALRCCCFAVDLAGSRFIVQRHPDCPEHGEAARDWKAHLQMSGRMDKSDVAPVKDQGDVIGRFGLIP